MRALTRSLRVVVELGREVWWVARCLPRLTLFLLIAAAGLWALGQHLPAVGSGLGLGLLFAWPQLHPASWLDVTDQATQRAHRDDWVRTCVAVGLSVPGPGSAGEDGPRRLVPGLRKARCRGGVETIRLRLANGQTLEDVDRAAPALAASWGAHAVRVGPDGPSGALLTLALRDLLAHPTGTPLPSGIPAGHPLARVELGRALSGDPWTADARVHTLVAGMTGAGKGSVMWSLLVALAPAVHAGTVRLVGVDLKAGMELTHAPALFSALATTPEQAVAVLEREADLLTARADAMAGQTRTHQPTESDPHVLVVVDELAALTAYITDPQLRRRADTALRILLTQGRAPGWSVWAWVQDPRKDTVPMRNLFPQMLGLRLKDAFETEMVLGEAATKTAPCHRIDPRHPGTGYAVTQDGSVSKVRAHYASDDLIHHINDQHPARHLLPAVSLAPAPHPYGLGLRAVPTPGQPAQGQSDPETPAPPEPTHRARRLRKPRAQRASTRAGEPA